jgi:voltage-gated potassium channel
MSAAATTADHHQPLEQARGRLARQVAALLDGPMTFLAFVWLILLVLDLTHGLNRWETLASNTIWVVFIVHFGLELVIAPDKWAYLRQNWLTALALLLPALRVLRVFRAFRVLRAAKAVRSTGLVRIVTSLNRGAGALRRGLRRRGFRYVVALTVIVTFAGAAGIFNFENPSALQEEGWSGPGISSYGEAIWWTAMMMTTMGSDYFPKTSEGRLLAWALAVYAFAVFGYITATLASYFIGADKKTPPAPAAEHDGLRAEVAALRERVEELLAHLGHPRPATE